MKRLLILLAGSLVSFLSTGQAVPFSIQLEPININGFSGLQSYAWGRIGDNILLVGGRLEGLHKRQPFASFSKTYNNQELIVINIRSKKLIKRDLGSLPRAISEQLQSSNMEFYQDGDNLILAGGYGYSETSKNHISFPSLIIIKLEALIQSIKTGDDINSSIMQITDERMAITGGNLGKLEDYYYLVGGHRFTGRYNPHGPDHGPGYSQQYSNQIRKFKLKLDQKNPSISNYEAITDTTNFHRRDYNLVNQYDENGKEQLSVYSGVFQPNADLPYTTVIDISPSGYRSVADFNQQLNHYHSAHLPVYDPEGQKQFAIFFGGIAWHYIDSSGKINKDDNVPFVKTISVVERGVAGTKEYALPENMPGFFGASAAFIPGEQELFTSNSNLKWASIGEKPRSVGFILGGIDSRAPNVLWSNDPQDSRASPVLWEVFLSRTQ